MEESYVEKDACFRVEMCSLNDSSKFTLESWASRANPLYRISKDNGEYLRD